MSNREGYKGFDPDFKCRGKEYKENTVFEESQAIACMKGMHYCTNPFDVLNHYGFVNKNGEFNEFAEVESLADPISDSSETKFCTTKLKIKAKLGFKGFLEACIDFVLEKTKYEADDMENSGDYAQIGSSGYNAKIGSSGDNAQIGSSGYNAKIGSSGNYAQIGSSGEDSVIMCCGIGSKAKAKKGSWITLSEWEWSISESRYVPKCVKTEYVDGEKIKEDTFYMLKNGRFTEAN